MMPFGRLLVHTRWLVSAGAVTVVVVAGWLMLDFVLDTFGPPPPREWPPSAAEDGSAA